MSAESDGAEARPASTTDQPTGNVGSETAKSYFDVRLKPQLAWYETRSRTAKRWNVGLVTTQLLTTSSIPVANALVGTSAVSTAFAALAAIATGFLQLGKFHENWVRYRSTVGALQAIKLRYELGLPPFDGEDRHARLIEEAEKAILQEGAQWSAEIAGQAGDKAARTQQPVR
jgi:hypothetical protein